MSSPSSRGLCKCQGDHTKQIAFKATEKTATNLKRPTSEAKARLFFRCDFLLCSSLLENTSQCGTSTIATVLKDLPRPHHKAFSTIWDMPLCGIVSERNRQPIQSVKSSALAPLSPPSDDTLACSSELPTTKISTRYKPSGSHVRLASRDISAP